MGSTRFYREQRRLEGIHFALIMDLVGHDVELSLPGLDAHGADLLFMTGAESHLSLSQIVNLAGPTLLVTCYILG
ncbi:MAG: hypothetical protein ABGX16_09620 [Pirellulales bacterium]